MLHYSPKQQVAVWTKHPQDVSVTRNVLNRTKVKVLYTRWTLCLVDKLIKYTLSKSEIFSHNLKKYQWKTQLFSKKSNPVWIGVIKDIKNRFFHNASSHLFWPSLNTIGLPKTNFNLDVQDKYSGYRDSISSTSVHEIADIFC